MEIISKSNESSIVKKRRQYLKLLKKIMLKVYLIHAII